ncbi:MAG: hypothetical protein IKY69_03890 [Bacteroidaceae bacterium]|jgi:hypothetical protein|nr:hypothetical protein [Bacteroidaceae bacterium]MBR5848593.1 hypothetical protein [Bacteroidaceae bacterium]
MYTIQANASGTRTLEVTEKYLETIRKYSLLTQIADSTGNVSEETLDKVRFTLRSLVGSAEEKEDAKELLELCFLFYNDNMKPLGLSNLIELYKKWEATAATDDSQQEAE